MRKLLSWGAIAYTAKTAWWDKLPKEDQQKYINQAKGLFDKHKGTISDAGKKFKEQHSGLKGDKKTESDGSNSEKTSGVSSVTSTNSSETSSTSMTPNHPRP